MIKQSNYLIDKVNSPKIVVDFRGQNLQNQLTINESKTISVSPYVNQNVSVLWDTNSTDFVSISVDFKNTVAETDENNNYVKKTTRDPINANINVAVDYPVLSGTIQNFLGQYVNIVTSGQDVNIYVGRKNSNIPKNEQTTKNQKWELKNNLVRFNSKQEGLPYNGIVVRKNNNIYVFGNDIDGDIAALRKLVANQQFYFSKSAANKVDYIGEESLDGIFVFDYLHTDENQPKYRKNDNNFATVVLNVLNSDVSTLSIKRVLTTNDNTSLRLKHINAELSPKFQQFSNPQPVVLAAGLHNNLFTWEDFGLELSKGIRTKNIRDTWLIEITGGPNTECKTCPNYDFNDLITYYFPALLAGVQKYSNKTNLTYVGFSNGCRTALSSLELYQNAGKTNAGYYNSGTDWLDMNLSANPIGTFVAVGCPGAFEGDSPFKTYFSKYYNQIHSVLLKDNLTHVDADRLGKYLLSYCLLNGDSSACTTAAEKYSGDYNISLNLAKQYGDWMAYSNDSQPGLGLSFNNFEMVYGKLPPIIDFFAPGSSDGVVTVDDSNSIYYVINSNNKRSQLINKKTHAELREDEKMRDSVEDFINR
ncbi:MAG: hypothetical protein AABX00_06415 [Nanoarchaeota archaeon]